MSKDVNKNWWRWRESNPRLTKQNKSRYTAIFQINKNKNNTKKIKKLLLKQSNSVSRFRLNPISLN